MVRREDHDGVFQIALPFQGGQDLAHFLVNHGHVGQVIRALKMALFLSWVEIQDDRIMIHILIVLSQFLQGRRLIVELLRRDLQQRQISRGLLNG